MSRIRAAIEECSRARIDFVNQNHKWSPHYFWMYQEDDDGSRYEAYRKNIQSTADAVYRQCVTNAELASMFKPDSCAKENSQ